MIVVVLSRLILDLAFCCGLLVVGRSLSNRDAPAQSPVASTQKSHMINGDGMTQQVSVTLNVNPNQIKVGSDLFFSPLSPARWAKGTALFLKKRGPFIAIGATIVLYWMLRRLCLQCNNYLTEKNSWAAWIGSDSYDQFLSRPQEEIAHDLIPAIQHRYVQLQDPLDFFEPLVLFVKDLAAEIENVNSYVFWYAWLKRCHVTSLFPLNTDEYDRLEKTKACLEYLKKVFLQWAADYKITHNAGNALIGRDE